MRTWLPLFIIVGLVTAAIWFTDSQPGELLGKRPTPKQQDQAADLVIRGAKTRHFNLEGKQAYRVDAEAISFYQFGRRDRADLTMPRIVFFQEDQPKWLTVSQTGVAHNNGQRVVLSGEVNITELPEPGGIQLNTPAITIFPHREFAQTDKVVNIVTGSNRTQGKGLRADLKKERVEILSQVTSTYETD